ncbi:SDR family NAD(P)-dependent oxidoreductase [Demequina aurantiaca]|uniref:SDR family NAD(P)-dependent oxidoreductase n=1 Tax=Demequina aurantiaca TaxID=676200 RepID=UPI000784E8BF|nr:SDR family NAD(P)-dependent oxidoreductase [Demequina aurantiaca]
MNQVEPVGAGVSGRLWEDKVAIVTGGSQGIGAAIAEQGVADGARVWIFDIADHEGQQTAERIGDHCHFLHVDVTDEQSIADAVAEVVGDAGRVDILVNNASGDGDDDALTMTVASWDSHMRLNLTSAWLMARAVLPSMIETGGGSIVNIGSLHSRMTAEGAFPYAAGKAGLGGLTRTLALDYGPQGVRVNMVCPGWTRSERIEAHFAEIGDEAVAAIVATHALRRVATPQDIAPVVSFIASDHASFITAATLDVDGGLSARFA